MPVVVVESPAKAKTINKYLGDDYTVLASFGHVRDLPPKDGSVDPDENFAMKWEVAADSKKHLKAIRAELANFRKFRLLTERWIELSLELSKAKRKPPSRDKA